MAVVPLLSDEEAGAEALAVFDDIRAKRQTDYINTFWRALAHDTATAKAKGMSLAQHAELLSVIALAAQTNALATALSVPVDDRFKA